MKQKVTFFGTFAVCCAVSFIIGHISSDPEHVSAPNPSVEAVDTRAGSQPGQNYRQGDRPRRSWAASRSDAQNDSHERTTRPASPTSVESRTARMKSIIGNRNILDRTADWFEFVTTLNPTEFQDLATLFVTDYSDGVYYADYNMLLDTWARHDPLAALNHAEESDQMNTSGGTVLAVWGATDPDAAMNWIESNRDRNDINYRIADVITGIASRDLKRANRIAMQMPESTARHQAIDVLAEKYLIEGNESALNWALSLENEKMRKYAIHRMARTLASINPESGTDLLPSESSEIDQDFINKVIDYMSKQR